jgi:predicted Rossmann fold flavoprotein
MKKYDIIITGAGPAGLFCAVSAAKSGIKKILVLEKNLSPGKKFLLSGSGQCNITHSGTVSSFTQCYGSAGSFVKPALSAFTPEDLIEFLEQNNIPVTERDDGKIFPASMRASDVLSMLTSICRSYGVDIMYNTPVKQIACSAGKFRLSSDHRDNTLFTAPLIVIASGGMSYPATGSTGDGFKIAESLGHSIVSPVPALTPVFIKNFIFSGLSGITLKGRNISVFRKNKKLISEKGDILFTHKGLSGPGLLDMSRYIERGDTVKIPLAIEDADVIKRCLIDESRSGVKKSIKNYLKKLNIPERLISPVLEELKIDPAKNISEVSKDERTKLITSLTSYSFNVEEKGGFKIAMATSGGVCRDEINRKTMESKIISGLYFAGEVIDVDGDTGGYNIQWAFSSGSAAGKACASGSV